MATGVIDLAAFLNTLTELGCDAPVRCEPFNAALRAMPPEQALAATIAAMKKAFDLIR
jgi:sugar phosphate isomerase/epimerase